MEQCHSGRSLFQVVEKSELKIPFEACVDIALTTSLPRE